MAESDLPPDERLQRLGELLTGGRVGLTVDCLVDSFLALYDECTSSEMRREKVIADFVKEYEPVVKDIRRHILRRSDFETLKVIGRGAFGEVHLVRQKHNKQVYAMKILNKWEMLKRQESACFKEERSVLLQAQSEFLTALNYCFQDNMFLYLVMEFYPGGDLLTLITKFDEDMSEEMATFYIAEVVLAVEAIHRMGFVHRDVKPDNVLIDKSGHVRLADFGSCAFVGDTGVITSPVAVGTPDYISPDVLKALEGKGSYGKESDWWSVGVMLYELLVGVTPFYNDTLMGTYAAITNFKELEFPDDVELSEDVKDLIRKLLTSQKERLGYKSVDDIKRHPWFKGVDWANIRNKTPPFVPDVSSLEDSSNFNSEDFEDRPEVLNTAEPKKRQAFSGNQLPFVGFSYLPALAGAIHANISVKTSSAGSAIVGTLEQSTAGASADWKAEIEALRKDKSRLEGALKAAATTVPPSPLLSDGTTSSDRRVAELEITQTKLQKDLANLQASLDAERSKRTQATSQNENLEGEHIQVKAELAEALKAVSAVERQLKVKEAEVSTLQTKLDMESDERNFAVKSKKEANAKLDAMRAEFDEAVLGRQKAEKRVAELQRSLLEVEKKTQSESKDSALAEEIKAKEKLIVSLKQQLEDERDNHDSDKLEFKEKLAQSTTSYQNQINKLNVDIERLTANKINLEQAHNDAAEELQALSGELSKAVDDLFMSRKEKTQFTSEVRALEEKVKALKAQVEDEQKLVGLANKVSRDAKDQLAMALQKLQHSEAEKARILADNDQVRKQLIEANDKRKGQDDQSVELQDAIAKYEAEVEIRKMLEESRDEMAQEVKRLQDQLEAAQTQRQKLQQERNDLSVTLDPLRTELAREKSRGKDIFSKTSTLESEVANLKKKLDEAQRVSEQTIESLKKRRDADVQEAGLQLEQAESRFKASEKVLSEAQQKSFELEGILSETKRDLLASNKKVEELAVKLHAAESSSKAPSSSQQELASDFAEARIAQLERAVRDLEAEIEQADAATERFEQEVLKKNALVAKLELEHEQQVQQTIIESRRGRKFKSDIEVLKGDLERETTRRKEVEAEKEKLLQSKAALQKTVEKATLESEDLADKLQRAEQKLREAQESLDILRESSARELAAMKLERSKSIKDMSIEAKEANFNMSNVRRRQTMVDGRTPGEERKRLVELDTSNRELKALLEEEQLKSAGSSFRVTKLEQDLAQAIKAKALLEQVISELKAKSAQDAKKIEQLTIELGSTNEELELISVRYDEQQLSRVEIESKLHRKEAESKQMGLDLTDALAARKELTNQLTQLRDELSKQEKFVFKLEVGRKRLERDLDDLKGQLVSTGVDGQVKSLLDQIKRKDAQLEETNIKHSKEFEALMTSYKEEKKALQSDLEQTRQLLVMHKGNSAEMKNKLDQFKSSSMSLSMKRRSSEYGEEAFVRREKADLEVKLQMLNATYTDTLSKLESAQLTNMKLESEISELRQAQQIGTPIRSTVSISDLSELQRLLDVAEAEKERLHRIIKEADIGSADELARRRSRKVRENWKANHEEKLTNQEVRTLRQDLEVTIQAKLQLDKMVQDLKVEKETLLQNQENLHQKVTDLSSERDREKERARVLEERLNHASLSKLDVPVTSPSSTPFTARSHGHKRTESSKAKWSPVPERKPGLTTSTSTEDLHRPDSPVSFDGQHHRFNVSSLAGPTRCDFCSQIAFGLVRQGLVCDHCGYVVHKDCQNKCGTHCGQGAGKSEDTVEGFLKMTKPKGIKAGWKKIFAAVSGNSLYLFNAEPDNSSQSVECVVDLSASSFKVADVHPNDVIHASRKDANNIFRIHFGDSLEPPRLLLASSLAEKAQWIKDLDKLHRKFEASAAADPSSSTSLKLYASLPKEADKNLSKIPAGITALRFVEPSTFLIGTDLGVFVNQPSGFVRVTPPKNILQLEVVQEFKLIIILAGKSQSIRILPLGIIRSDPNWGIELEITKGCQKFSIGYVRGELMLVALVKKRLIVFTVDSKKLFPKIMDFTLPDQGTTVRFLGSYLIVGFGNKFRLHTINEDKTLAKVVTDLPSREEKGLQWLLSQALVPLTVFRLNDSFLLCYNVIGVFVNASGMLSKTLELHWTSTPLAFSLRNGFLFVYTAEYIDVWSLDDGQVKQVIPRSSLVAVDTSSRVVATQETVFALEYVGSGMEKLDVDLNDVSLPLPTASLEQPPTPLASFSTSSTAASGPASSTPAPMLSALPKKNSSQSLLMPATGGTISVKPAMQAKVTKPNEPVPKPALGEPQAKWTRADSDMLKRAILAGSALEDEDEDEDDDEDEDVPTPTNASVSKASPTKASPTKPASASSASTSSKPPMTPTTAKSLALAGTDINVDITKDDSFAFLTNW